MYSLKVSKFIVEQVEVLLEQLRADNFKINN